VPTEARPNLAEKAACKSKICKLLLFYL